MSNILNITNGDSSVEIMQQANIPGKFLPWRDVLHEGPVPDNLTLDELSKVRAKFIIDRGWGIAGNIIDSFIQRDNELKSLSQKTKIKYEKVILWFEHDLYDQLQIIQILDWFSQYVSSKVELSIICTDQYLGRLTPEQMLQLKKDEKPITKSHLRLSQQAWSALRSNSPQKWRQLLTIDTSVLPFLEGAALRLLEEYPNCSNGLSRTAEQALKIISVSEKISPARLFGAVQQTEERIFMGDTSFWVVVEELLASNPPLITLSEEKKLAMPLSTNQQLAITAVGIDVLTGNKNWLDIATIDHWIGGVHLTATNIWCWNSSLSLLNKA